MRAHRRLGFPVTKSHRVRSLNVKKFLWKDERFGMNLVTPISQVLQFERTTIRLQLLPTKVHYLLSRNNISA